MIKMGNLKGILNIISAFAKQHSPELLVGLGIAGMATSTVLAVKATPKAVARIDKIIEDKNEQLMDEAVAKQQSAYSPITKLKKGDVIKLCWKDYAPAAITGVASIVCIIGGTHINLRRNAALVTAVKLSEVTIKDLQAYKDKVVETIGEEKSDEIEAKVNENVVQQAAINLDSAIVPGVGPILCLDKIGGQWFRSDKETIREAINRLNYTMNDDMYVSLNDFYDEIGISHTVAGEQLGWNRDQGLIEPKFSSHLLPSGVPVMVITTRIEPRTDYSKLY
jgi:hypothetical protein